MNQKDNNNFFDNRVKEFLKTKTGKNYYELEEWAEDLMQKINDDQKDLYPDSESYENFYLLYIFRFKDKLEILWTKYRKFADKSFKSRMLENKEKFQQYLWEMYLTIYLLDIPGVQINRNKQNKGPDIEISYQSKKYYIECIAPTQGLKYDENGIIKSNYLPPIKMNTVAQLPITIIKIRIMYALKEKIKKYKKYCEIHTINTEDNLGIAINTSCLSQYGSLMDFNQPLIKEICEEIKLFETYTFIDFVIYSHKSIFDYNPISIIILKKDYSILNFSKGEQNNSEI